VREHAAVKAAFTKSAVKAIRKLQPAKAADIREAIAKIAADPFAKNNNVKPLSGRADSYRARVGDWRVSYIIDRSADLIEVFEIAPRGGAYR
jgi:mRNA interferase RelE/StbE